MYVGCQHASCSQVVPANGPADRAGQLAQAMLAEVAAQHELAVRAAVSGRQVQAQLGAAAGRAERFGRLLSPTRQPPHVVRQQLPESPSTLWPPPSQAALPAPSSPGAAADSMDRAELEHPCGSGVFGPLVSPMGGHAAAGAVEVRTHSIPLCSHASNAPQGLPATSNDSSLIHRHHAHHHHHHHHHAHHHHHHHARHAQPLWPYVGPADLVSRWPLLASAASVIAWGRLRRRTADAQPPWVRKTQCTEAHRQLRFCVLPFHPFGSMPPQVLRSSGSGPPARFAAHHPAAPPRPPSSAGTRLSTRLSARHRAAPERPSRRG